MCGFLYSNNKNAKAINFDKILEARGGDQSDELNIDIHTFYHNRQIYSGNSENGRQPVYIKSINSVLLYNGEIYNFGKFDVEKRAFLGDTEYLSHLLQNFPFDEVVNQIDGMFAIVLVQLDDGQVNFARDHYGQKPLYFSLGSGDVTVSSSSLVCSLMVKENCTLESRIDETNLINYFLFGFVPENSIYQGVREIPAGTFGIIHKNKLITKNLRFKVIETIGNSLISDSIRETSFSSDNVAIALSGGIDSTAIASFFNKNKVDQDILCVNIGSTDKRFNEADQARETATLLNLPFFSTIPEKEEILEAYSTIFGVFDEPIADSGLVPNYIVAKYAKKLGCNVLLCGDGGDEIFGGYNRHAFYDQIFLSNLASFKRHLIKNLPIKILFQLFKYTKFGGGALKSRLNILKATASANSTWQFYISALSGLKNLDDLPNLLANKKDLEVNNKEMAEILKLDKALYLKGNNLHRGDRISMSCHIECRAPFLSKKFAGFVGQKRFDNKKILQDYINSNDLKYISGKKKGFSVMEQFSLNFNTKLEPFLSEIISEETHCILKLSPFYEIRRSFLGQWLEAQRGRY